MKNKLLVVGIVVVALAIGGVLIFKNIQGSTNQAPVVDELVDEGEKVDDSRYAEYSKEIFDRTFSSRRVLFFYANWCPTCRPADESFKENINQIPGDVSLLRVNYNDTDTDEEEKELAKKYDVTYQHTFVLVNENGDEVAKWNGGGIEDLLTNLSGS